MSKEIEKKKKLLDDIARILVIEKELIRRKNQFNPMTYGLPDLMYEINYNQGYLDKDGVIVRKRLKKRENGVAYKNRRLRDLKKCIESFFYIVKDGRKINIKLIKDQVEYIGDSFFGYSKCNILWKSRGGGGSLCVSLYIFLSMVYRYRSFNDLAGSGEQAKNVYNYVCQFWECFPLMKRSFVDGDLLLSLIKLKLGIYLKCLAASQKQVRGLHCPGLVIDEGCQEDRRLDDVFLSAINGVMSEENFEINIASTFHVPVGFYQEFWDSAESKGFRRHKWNIYKTMKTCRVGIDTATKKDKKALEYCRTKCPLTDKVEEFDNDGNLIGYIYEGCNGIARDSEGWLKRDSVIKTKSMNDRDTFRVEFECNRPKFSGPIFGRDNIEKSEVTDIEIDVSSGGIVGIDWGYSTEGAMILLKESEDSICVIDAVFLTKQKISEWLDVLEKWGKYCGGEMMVYADGSHPMCNRELEEYGYDVIQVYFQKMREYCEFNLAKYFSFGKIKIYSKLTRLLDQLYKYRKNNYGKIIKENDHGPDALEAGMIHFDFMDKFGLEIREKVKGEFASSFKDLGKKSESSFEII